MANKVKIIKTNEEFKVFADPYRMSIIDVYVEQAKPLTVKQVADILGEVPAKVHYHIKKMISIDILELDHIEVINGINAKYYHLVYDSFTIDLEETNNQVKALQVDSVAKVLIKKVDDFKDAIVKRAQKVKTEPRDKDADGFLSVTNVYLSNEEQTELRNLITDYIRNHSKKDDKKSKFSIIAGLVGKE